MSGLSQTYRKWLEGKPLNTEEIGQLVRGFEAQEDVKDTLAKYLDFGARDLSIPTAIALLDERTLQEDVSSIDISIVGDSKHLLIHGQGKINGTGGALAAQLYGQFNNDTSSAYQWANIAYSSGATGGSSNSDVNFWISPLPADGAPAADAGSFWAYIPHYRAAGWKQIYSLAVLPYAGSGANVSVALKGGVWQSTDPIQNVQFIPDTTTYPNAKLATGFLLTILGVG